MKAIDHSNFNEVYGAYNKDVMNYLKFRIKSNEDCEDIYAETFSKVHRNLKSYNPAKGQFNTWILNITKNAMIDHLRRNKGGKFVNVDDLTKEGEALEQIIFIEDENSTGLVHSKDISTDIQKAMETLKPNYRMVAEMYLRQNRPYTEIAEILDLPMGTVKVTLLRAKEMLQQQLKKYQYSY